MQTTRTSNERTNLQDRSRRRAIGAHLIVVGALGALAAASLSILMADAGGRVPTSVGTRPAVAAAAPADQDRSWLCSVISDDSGPESRVAATDALARRGITCAVGQGTPVAGEAVSTLGPAAMTVVGHDVVGAETRIYPPAHSTTWGEEIGPHAVSVIAGTLTVHSGGAAPASFGPGQGYVAGWAPYRSVNDGSVPVEVVVTLLARRAT